ncbi:uncharacterized protein LOC143425551 [Xylocopa sonorina]|uniref:uncharacterized protein LOC143425551 n=1 Tax=Xylocopa sonorina TaxID=1818115 RepID=UPI00403B27A9
MARLLTCLRYFLSGSAIVLGVCGLIESICAGFFIYQLYEYSPLTPGNVCGSSITLLVIGLIMGVVAWCTWQFLKFTNTGQVIIFSVALILIMIVNLSAGTWALVKHEQVDLLPKAHLEHVFKLAVSDDKPIWDRMQSKLHCCGVNGPSDYQDQDAVPWSCCDTSLSDSSDKNGACTTLYAHGCQHAVLNRTRSILLHIFLLALCTVSLQVCFITCMFCYVRAYRERREKRKIELVATQSLTRASKDAGAGGSLLNN